VADPLVTKAHIEGRVGADTLRRILDYNNDGATDPAAVLRFCEDATSKIRGALGPWYDTATSTAANADTATELRRIAIDAVLAMIARDFPNSSGWDWISRMEQVDRDLKMIRNGRADLGGGVAPPAQRSQRARVLPTNRSGGRGWNDC
jgi:hypothetical protein